MTISEIRKKIALTENAEELNKVEVTIEYPHINFSEKLIGLSSVHQFLKNQIQGYDKLTILPTELNHSKQHFTNLLSELENIVNHSDYHRSKNFPHYWHELRRQLESKQFFFTFDAPETHLLLECYQYSEHTYKGAYYFLIDRNLNQNNPKELSGALLAYEFKFQEKSIISTRRSKERQSINQIKTRLNLYLNQTEKEVADYIVNIEKKYTEFVTLINDLKTDKEKLFDQWFEGDAENEGAKTKAKTLENYYEEKLRLQKPAEHWHNRAKKMNEEGWKAIKYLVLLIVFGCTTLYCLLWLTPKGMLLSFMKGDAQAIKWSVIYVTFISFLAFGIRIINKFAFSSFHLARDAEEREQLTYFYLSLIKDKSIEADDRSLVMQSLFSRADTGLLKDDGGPTMPNDIPSKLISKSL